MKRKNILFFLFSFLSFLSNMKLIPASRRRFSETVAYSVSAKLGRFRALHLAIFAREGKKGRKEKRKKGGGGKCATPSTRNEIFSKANIVARK